MVDPSELREQLKRYEAELRLSEAQAGRIIARMESLQQVVQGLRALIATAEPEPTQTLFTPSDVKTTPPPDSHGEILNGREAVRRVLIESRRAWKIPDLAMEIQKRGWMPDVSSPRDATAASVQRLHDSGEVERVGHGVYRYRLDKLPPLEPDLVPTSRTTVVQQVE